MAEAITQSQEEGFKEFEDFCKWTDGKFDCWASEFASGSIAELMPIFNSYRSAELDIDVLIWVDHILAIHPWTENEAGYNATFDSDRRGRTLEVVEIDDTETAVGYVRLYKRPCGSFVTHTELHRISSRLTESDELTLKGRGPASTYELPTDVMGQQSPLTITGFDNVFFIRCAEWPLIAEAWKTRARPSGWPPESLVTRCVELGCLFVPASHINSKKPEEEFRYSFSFAELLLIRSWNPLQKFVLASLKQLKNKIRKRLQQTDADKKDFCLRSYHLKTLLFWACEERQKTFWDGDVQEVLRDFVHLIIERLQNRNCPHYFISDCNLFDQLNVDEHVLQGVIASLKKEIETLCSEAIISYKTFKQCSKVTINMPVMVVTWLQLFNIDPIISTKASMFELYDLHRALQFQKSGQKSDAEQHFQKAIEKNYSQKKLEASSWEDLISSGARVACWDESDKSFEQLLLPLTERRDESYPAFLASKLFSRQKHNEGTIPLDLSGMDWNDFVKAVFPVRQSWLCSMAYYANYKYMQSDEAGYKRAIELCDEAIKFHTDIFRQELEYRWIYEGCYAVTLYKRLSWAYDESVKSLFDEKSSPVPICPISFIFYIKIRCLLRCNMSKKVEPVLEAWRVHLVDFYHKTYYRRSEVTENQLVSLSNADD